ncbi:MFS transporter [bacterium]|nr:MFS transporter [bacterium]
MKSDSQKLTFLEKAGYSCGDAAANFVFMTMILFQPTFYEKVFGLKAGLAATIILVARLWDAFFDPVMGSLADRTRTRWGRFRPWILWTSIPWGIVMILAYSVPDFVGPTKIFYAFITNTILMTLYSANNMPYSALGGVMTGDVQERASLNSYRFVAVNVAQFIVGGFTLPLVAKFAGTGDPSPLQAHGWQVTMSIWAGLCVVLFLITFFTTKERIQPVSQEKTSVKQDFSDLLKNSPWAVMFFMTLVHFTILALRGTAWYNYFHFYADKAAWFGLLKSVGLTAAPLAEGATASGGVLETLGYIVHADPSSLATSNVADVANSIINMLFTATTIVVILLSPALAKRFGKKAVAVTGFALSTITAFLFYLLKPGDVAGQIIMTIIIAVVYAPTIPLLWAMFADVADYSEWQTGRRATGIVFATIGFALKAGLSLGGAAFLWIMPALYQYESVNPNTPIAREGMRMCSSVYIGILFAICTILLALYKIDKNMTQQIADELEDRRKKAAGNKA